MNQKHIIKLLAKNDIKTKKATKLRNDASNRTYYRIPKKNLLVAHMPREKKESINKFKMTTRVLKQNQIKVPNIIDTDRENDLLLIEDFGETKLSKIMNNQNKKKYLKLCLDEIINLQKIKPTKAIKEFNVEKIIAETMLFVDWYLIKDQRKKITNAQKEIFKRKIKYLYSSVKGTYVYGHMDYHVDNIFYFKNSKSIGLIDYQDIKQTHVAYDVLSILQDVRNPIKKSLEKELVEYFLKKSECNKYNFKSAYNFFSIQRNLKIIGIFSRLKHRDRKNNYYKLIPICFNLIKKNLKDTKAIKCKNFYQWLVKEYEIV